MRKTNSPRRGAAAVELAITCSLLFVLLFGIAEMGLIFRDQATLNQSGREAARSLSLGSSTSVAKSRAVNSATGITLTTAAVSCDYSTDGGSTWTAVSDLTDPNGNAYNNAPSGSLVRATITYSHPLVTHLIYNASSRALTSKVIMRRE
jgi:Flp pilus assembly protein TadG